MKKHWDCLLIDLKLHERYIIYITIQLQKVNSIVNNSCCRKQQVRYESADIQQYTNTKIVSK